MCTACFEGANDEFHPDSRLMIVRCGLNDSDRLQKNVPDTYYFVMEQGRFCHKRLATTAIYYAALSKKRCEKAKQRMKELQEAEFKAKSNAA